MLNEPQCPLERLGLGLALGPGPARVQELVLQAQVLVQVAELALQAQMLVQVAELARLGLQVRTQAQARLEPLAQVQLEME